ncbi:hypothetical protein B0J18DRAFT_131347 [Chaetomium sp. MPI-SDFR-AT-0129]|nr:hypothetical protein B0J18DRAFT_131347 [Chaetomium sp. MPI-SDFR-AT-0129]
MGGMLCEGGVVCVCLGTVGICLTYRHPPHLSLFPFFSSPILLLLPIPSPPDLAGEVLFFFCLFPSSLGSLGGEGGHPSHFVHTPSPSSSCWTNRDATRSPCWASERLIMLFPFLWLAFHSLFSLGLLAPPPPPLQLTRGPLAWSGLRCHCSGLPASGMGSRQAGVRTAVRRVTWLMTI